MAVLRDGISAPAPAEGLFAADRPRKAPAINPSAVGRNAKEQVTSRKVSGSDAPAFPHR